MAQYKYNIKKKKMLNNAKKTNFTWDRMALDGITKGTVDSLISLDTNFHR